VTPECIAAGRVGSTVRPVTSRSDKY
jgi:hypothetical protein